MSVPGLRALESPPYATIQDMGRIGWRRFGVSSAGAMDTYGLAATNVLVGNPSSTAALEFAFAGGSWEVDTVSCRIAVAGPFDTRVDGRKMPAWSSLTVRRGQRIDIGGSRGAIWGYLAIAGGLAVEPTLGSRSTHRRSAIGGLAGRGLTLGDMLPLALNEAPPGPDLALRGAGLANLGPIRAIVGPQDDRFTAQALHDFFNEEFVVTNRCDRLGYCLSGPILRHVAGADIISDGVVPGCVQVPGSGQPIVLMRDCQPPGGYAKLACVVSADLGRFSQLRAGQTIRFQQVGVAEAALLRSDFQARLLGLSSSVVPISSTV